MLLLLPLAAAIKGLRSRHLILLLLMLLQLLPPLLLLLLLSLHWVTAGQGTAEPGDSQSERHCVCEWGDDCRRLVSQAGHCHCHCHCHLTLSHYCH